jgi:hypothetical protein
VGKWALRNWTVGHDDRYTRGDKPKTYQDDSKNRFHNSSLKRNFLGKVLDTERTGFCTLFCPKNAYGSAFCAAKIGAKPGRFRVFLFTSSDGNNRRKDSARRVT